MILLYYGSATIQMKKLWREPKKGTTKVGKKWTMNTKKKPNKRTVYEQLQVFAKRVQEVVGRTQASR